MQQQNIHRVCQKRRNGHIVRRVALLIAFGLSGITMLFSTFHMPANVHAATRHLFTGSDNISAVVVIDNISLINQRDPHSDRYSAAALFVDLAQEGDQIGTVEIPSTPQVDTTQGYQKPLLMSASNKSKLKSIIYGEQYNPTPNAYFTPALKEAGNMLQGATGQKYIIVVTDSAAKSADTGNCNAPTNYQWYCEITTLRTQYHISIVFLAFTVPGYEGEFTHTQQFLRDNGGDAREVDSTGATFIQDLASEYTTIYGSIHSNVFKATLDSGINSITVDNRIPLSSLTFVALSPGTVSLTDLHQQSGTNVAGLKDGGYYNGQGRNGSIYWLETISTGQLSGTWMFGPSPPQVIVVATTSAHFILQNPALSDPNSEVSVRHIPQQGTIILRAEVTSEVDVPFTIVSNNTLFDDPARPLPSLDNDPSFKSAQYDIPQPPAGENTIPLDIGLGNAIAPGIYLSKSFTLEPDPNLPTTSITVPTPPVVPPAYGSPVHVTAQPVSSGTGITTQAALFSREETSNGPWVRSSGSSVEGDFPLTHGCGFLYDFASLELLTGPDFQYLTYQAGSYPSNLQPTLHGSVNWLENTSNTLLVPWWGQSKINLSVAFNSSICQGEPSRAKLALNVISKTFSAPVSIDSVDARGSSYTAQNGVVSVNVPTGNATFILHITAEVSGCDGSFSPFALLQPDRKGQLQVSSLPVRGQQVQLVLDGKTQWNSVCPSLLTSISANLLLTGIVALCFLWLYRQSSSWFVTTRERRRKPYLIGGIQFQINVPDFGQVGAIEPAPVDLPIPEEERRAVWWLDKLEDEISGGSYKFESRVSPFSRLEFRIEADDGGSLQVYAKAVNETTPYIPGTDIRLQPGEKCIVDGQPVQVADDLIIPEIEIS